MNVFQISCRKSLHGRHSGILAGRKVDEKERQEAAPPPGSAIIQILLFRASLFHRLFSGQESGNACRAIARRGTSVRYHMKRPYLPFRAGGQTRHARAGRVSCTFVVAFLSRCSRRAQTVSIAFSFLAAPLSPWSPLLPPASYLGVASPLFGGAWAVSVVFGMV